ncbi:MAG: 50S ribosomal protein L21 [Candidatus Aminicenantes bacterium]|nr:50S ribosomal protein L21 [Candidatus Aminicenantes bacterium]
MFAVIKTGGKQYRVQEGDVLAIEKLDAEEGKKVIFEEVLLVEGDGDVLIGTPLVDKALVKALVVEGFKDKKVVIFKKKRRKQYRKTKGHRQDLTRVKIEEILTGVKEGPKAKPDEKAASPKKVETPSVPKPKAKPEELKAEVEPEKIVEKKPVAKVAKKSSPAKPETVKKTAKAKSKAPAPKKTETGEKPKASKKKVTKE